MERYSRPLKSHILLVHEHATFLLKRLDSYSRLLAKSIKAHHTDTEEAFVAFNAEEKDLVIKMFNIRNELRCIEEEIFKKYPHLKELFKRLDKMPEGYIEDNDGE